MIEFRSIICLLMISILMASCGDAKKELFTPELKKVSLDGIEPSLNFKPKKIFVAYIHEKNPPPHLYQIEAAIESAIEKKWGYRVYVEAENELQLKAYLEKVNFPYPVYLDSLKAFRELNNEDIEGYNGYIINTKNEILGSPMLQYIR
jgi:hypothetical protein